MFWSDSVRSNSTVESHQNFQTWQDRRIMSPDGMLNLAGYEGTGLISSVFKEDDPDEDLKKEHHKFKLISEVKLQKIVHEVQRKRRKERFNKKGHSMSQYSNKGNYDLLNQFKEWFKSDTESFLGLKDADTSVEHTHECLSHNYEIDLALQLGAQRKPVNYDSPVSKSSDTPDPSVVTPQRTNPEHFTPRGCSSPRLSATVQEIENEHIEEATKAKKTSSSQFIGAGQSSHPSVQHLDLNCTEHHHRGVVSEMVNTPENSHTTIPESWSYSPDQSSHIPFLHSSEGTIIQCNNMDVSMLPSSTSEDPLPKPSTTPERAQNPQPPGGDKITVDKENAHNTETVKLPSPASSMLCGPKEGTYVCRIQKYRMSILNTMNEIDKVKKNIPKPDGIEDLRRRQKNAADFNARFNRNYLYELQRQVKELHRLMKRGPVAARPNVCPMQTICRKLVIAHQTSLQMCQFYLHHVPRSLPSYFPSKTDEVMHLFGELTLICNMLHVPLSDDQTAQGDLLQLKCREWLEQVESPHMTDMSETSKSTKRVGFCKFQKNMDKTSSNCSIHAKLSNQKQSWKKSSAALARAKFGSPCKKVLNPGILSLKNSGLEQMPATREDQKKREYSPPPKTIYLEDVIENGSIRTVVETIPKDDLSSGRERMSKEVKQDADLKMAPEKSASNTELIGQISTQLVKIFGDEIIKVMNPFIDNLAEMVSRKNKKRVTDRRSSEKPKKDVIRGNACLSCSDNQRRTDTGNVKTFTFVQEENRVIIEDDHKNENKHLLDNDQCLESVSTSDNCNVSLSQSSKEEVAVQQLKPRQKDASIVYAEEAIKEKLPSVNKNFKLQKQVKSHSSSSIPDGDGKTQSRVHQNKRKEQTQNGKMSRPVSLIVPKEDRTVATEYRDKFQKHRKGNALYNEEPLKPWIVIERVADMLVDSVLQDVINEANIDSFVSVLYNHEFQLQ